MEFKIDTKDTFTVIMPVCDKISANLAGELIENWEKARQSGSKNFIIDLQNCPDIDNNAVKYLVDLHQKSYELDSSLVYTGLNKKILETLKNDETDLLINIAPHMNEAIDIISMEILERDLLSEE